MLANLRTIELAVDRVPQLAEEDPEGHPHGAVRLVAARIPGAARAHPSHRHDGLPWRLPAYWNYSNSRRVAADSSQPLQLMSLRLETDRPGQACFRCFLCLPGFWIFFIQFSSIHFSLPHYVK